MYLYKIQDTRLDQAFPVVLQNTVREKSAEIHFKHSQILYLSLTTDTGNNSGSLTRAQ